MDRQGTTTAPRHIKVAIMDESELVVHGIRAMFEPHSAVVSVVPYRTTGPAPLCDLTLYEPSAFYLLRQFGPRAAAAFAEIRSIANRTSSSVSVK